MLKTARYWSPSMCWNRSSSPTPSCRAPVSSTGSDLAGVVEGDVAGAVRVVEEARADQEALLAVRDVSRLQPEQRMLGALLALFQQRSPEHRLLAGLRVTLVEDDVAGRVAVAEHRARVVARPRDGVGAVHAFAENLRFAGREVDAYAE